MLSDRCVCSSATHGGTKQSKSQYEDMMKSFCERNREKCRGENPEPSPCTYTKKEFPTGSSYKGQYEDMNMRGYGEYKFPNGVMYRGEFESNMCHGSGELIYALGPEEFAVIRGQWVKGIMTESKVFFCGVLEYNKDNWQYCKMPDRRFVVEFNKELKPAGLSNITAEQPPREIPPGFCDTGYGFYNLKTKVVYKYNNILEVLKAASDREQYWIESNCRVQPIGEIGPRKDLFENWLEPAVDPVPLPKLLVGFIPKRHSTFGLNVGDRPGHVFYDSSEHFERPARKFKGATK